MKHLPLKRRSQTAIYLFIRIWCLWAFSLKNNTDTALERIKRETFVIGPELGWAQKKKRNLLKYKHLQVYFVVSYLWDQQAGLVQSHCPCLQVHIQAVERHWCGCWWCLQRLGLDWEAAGRWSALNRVWAVPVPSAKGRVEFGCVLGCSFPLEVWPALDESCSHAEEAGCPWGHLHIYNCDSHLVRVSYAQKYVRSLINRIFRYSIIFWVRGTDALSNVEMPERNNLRVM